MDFQKAFSDLGEYVGTNQPLNLDENMMAFISSYSRLFEYNALYRLWSALSCEDVLDSIDDKGIYKVPPARAFTKTFEAAKKLYSSFYYSSEEPEVFTPLDSFPEDSLLVTQHKGLYGFEPIGVLKRALRDGIDGGDRAWAEHVIKENEYQQEVYVLEPVTELKKENIFKILY
jgi:hypothetical protein